MILGILEQSVGVTSFTIHVIILHPKDCVPRPMVSVTHAQKPGRNSTVCSLKKGGKNMASGLFGEVFSLKIWRHQRVRFARYWN